MPGTAPIRPCALTHSTLPLSLRADLTVSNSPPSTHSKTEPQRHAVSQESQLESDLAWIRTQVGTDLPRGLEQGKNRMLTGPKQDWEASSSQASYLDR